MDKKERTKFRNTVKWKRFRAYIKKKQNNIDVITGKKLLKGSNLHHLDLNSDNYSNLENEDNFVFLNKQTHEMIHWLYRYYANDKSILDRIKLYLDRMVEINED